MVIVSTWTFGGMAKLVSKCFAIATRRCSVLSKSFVKIAIPCQERKHCLVSKTRKPHSNIINSPCAEDPKVMEGHNTGGTLDWELCHITTQQCHTLKVLSVRHTHRCWGLLSGPQATHLKDAACPVRVRYSCLTSDSTSNCKRVV